jgi:glutathione synthase/RimK-type ligase-like ATP-grasp enzyme
VKLAILVPEADYAADWRWAYDIETDALIAAGAEVCPIVWSDPFDPAPFDLVLPLVAWGYHYDYERWLAFLDRAEAERLPVVNPPALLRWNSDKAYLTELADRSVPTVPTMAVEQCCDEDVEEARRRFGAEWLVIKPPVSASATGTFRLGPTDSLPAEAHGCAMIIQPLIEEIATAGEFSLMLFDGVFSHAVVKRPKSGDFRVQEHLGGTTVPSPPPPGGIALASAALAAAPARATYARVDMVPNALGELLIMELELIEPALFLDSSPDGGTAFGRSVLRAAQRLLKQPLP